MFCSRFCAVTMISVSAGWFEVSAAQAPSDQVAEIASNTAMWRRWAPTFVVKAILLLPPASLIRAYGKRLRVRHRRRQRVDSGRQKAKRGAGATRSTPPPFGAKLGLTLGAEGEGGERMR